MGLVHPQRFLCFFFFFFLHFLLCLLGPVEEHPCGFPKIRKKRLQASGWPFLFSLFPSPVFHFPSVFIHFHWFIFKKKIKFHVFSFVCFPFVFACVFISVHVCSFCFFLFSIIVCDAPPQPFFLEGVLSGYPLSFSVCSKSQVSTTKKDPNFKQVFGLFCPPVFALPLCLTRVSHGWVF